MRSSWQLIKRIFLGSLLLSVILLGSATQNTDAKSNCDTTSSIRQITVSADGKSANGDAGFTFLSGDGRYVSFDSLANNLVPNDTNHVTDAFVYDAQKCKMSRVSVSSSGVQSNGESTDAVVSDNGQVVTFMSEANNLVAHDTNGVNDVFAHNMLTGKTMRVSVTSNGTQDDGWSPWGGYPSSEGRYIAFDSYADNLVPGDTNDHSDVFVHDMVTGKTTLISGALDGTPGNGDSQLATNSADGRYIVFISEASNLVPDDTNGVQDVFIHDMVTDKTTRVSVASDGTQSNGLSTNSQISEDGQYVTFTSSATNLTPGVTSGIENVYIHSMQSGETQLVSVAADGGASNGLSDGSAPSNGGHYVSFSSRATNLISGGTNNIVNIFVRDMQSGKTALLSAAADGTQANANSEGWVPISSDGHYVAFQSKATNLVPGSTNGVINIFLARVPDLDTVTAPTATNTPTATAPTPVVKTSTPIPPTATFTPSSTPQPQTGTPTFVPKQ